MKIRMVIWLNEGITIFFQRKIVDLWKEDNNYTKINLIIDYFILMNI